MATPMTSSITIKTHIPTSSVQYVYPHNCSFFQLCFIVYTPHPSITHHMLVIVRHIYYFDYKGNETDHWFASKMYSTLKESISDSLTMYTYLTKSYLKYNLKRSTSLLKARYILRQIYV